MGKKRKRWKSNSYQLGGLLGGLFGGGSGGSLLEGISNSLQAFNNEPALQGVFGQSDSMFNAFQEQASAAGQTVNPEMKGIFDLASLFSTNAFGRSIFAEGGMVKKGKRLQDEAAGRVKALTDAAIEMQYQGVKAQTKQALNQKFDRPTNPKNVIPGLGEPYTERQSVTTKPPTTRRFQSGGQIPISQFGQFEFPGQMVGVPSPNGLITMDGVDQALLAIDEFGNQNVLQPNSGLHQLMPGMILEIPLDQKPKRRRKKQRRKTNSMAPNLPHSKGKDTLSKRIPRATVRNYNKRNRKTQFENKHGNIGLPFPK